MHVKEGSGHCWRENRSHPSAGSYGFVGWLLCLLSSSSLAGFLGSSGMFLHILSPKSNSWARVGWSERTPDLTLERRNKHAHAMQGFHGPFDASCYTFPFSLRQEGLLLSRESGGGGDFPYHSAFLTETRRNGGIFWFSHDHVKH